MYTNGLPPEQRAVPAAQLSSSRHLSPEAPTEVSPAKEGARVQLPCAVAEASAESGDSQEGGLKARTT